jgi:hypothetical protein
MTAEQILEMITLAVDAQINDESLWILDPSIGEAYALQSLRWLHRVIEQSDRQALAKIVHQSEDSR